MIERSGRADAEVGVAELLGEVEPVRRPRERGIAVEGAAAVHAAASRRRTPQPISRTRPHLVDAVLVPAPLQDVPEDVVKAEWVRSERPDRRVHLVAVVPGLVPPGRRSAIVPAVLIS